MSQSKLCVFISLEQTCGHILDDELCRPYLQAQGWELEEWAWTQDLPWERADLLVFRSCYDYWERLNKFLSFLDKLERLTVPVYNPLELVRWNMDKRYLFQLEAHGIPVLKSHLLEAGATRGELEVILGEYPDSQEFVLKPCVGAGGFEMSRLQASQVPDIEISARHLLQAFYETVNQGEWSVMFFGDQPSHAVKKIAKAGEYRVQDTHGGTTVSADLSQHPSLVLASRKVAQAMEKLGLPKPLYARYDFFEGSEPEELLLVEVELIEPTLFLQHCPGAAKRFTETLLSQ